MKKLAIAVAVMALCATGAFAADNDTLRINYEVKAINEIAITDEAVTLTVDTAVAGSQPEQATAGSTYGITTNGSDMKITGAIDTAMDTGLTLKANLTAPSVGTSASAVEMTEVAADLVTGITEVTGSGLALGLTLDATVDAGVVASAQKTLKITLTSAL